MNKAQRRQEAREILDFAISDATGLESLEETAIILVNALRRVSRLLAKTKAEPIPLAEDFELYYINAEDVDIRPGTALVLVNEKPRT